MHRAANSNIAVQLDSIGSHVCLCALRSTMDLLICALAFGEEIHFENLLQSIYVAVESPTHSNQYYCYTG